MYSNYLNKTIEHLTTNALTASGNKRKHDTMSNLCYPGTNIRYDT